MPSPRVTVPSPMVIQASHFSTHSGRGNGADEYCSGTIDLAVARQATCAGRGEARGIWLPNTSEADLASGTNVYVAGGASLISTTMSRPSSTALIAHTRHARWKASLQTLLQKRCRLPPSWRGWKPLLHQRQAHAGSIPAQSDSFPSCAGPGSSVGFDVGEEGCKIIEFFGIEAAPVRGSRGWSATPSPGSSAYTRPHDRAVSSILQGKLYLAFTVIRHHSRVIAGGGSALDQQSAAV